MFHAKVMMNIESTPHFSSYLSGHITKSCVLSIKWQLSYNLMQLSEPVMRMLLYIITPPFIPQPYNL